MPLDITEILSDSGCRTQRFFDVADGLIEAAANAAKSRFPALQFVGDTRLFRWRAVKWLRLCDSSNSGPNSSRLPLISCAVMHWRALKGQ
jgi:hypothetical protein